MLEASFMAFRMLPEKAEGMRPAMLSGLGRGLGRSTSGSSSLMEKNCPHPTTLHDPGLTVTTALRARLVNWFRVTWRGAALTDSTKASLSLSAQHIATPTTPTLL